MFYCLEGHTPVPIGGLEEIWRFAEVLNSNRRVAIDNLGGVSISTVFLGMDMNHMALALDLPVEEAPPLLFETLISDSEGHNRVSGRYSTWDEALTAHQRILGAVNS